MLPCISPPKITPMDPHETVLTVLYYMRLCFYVLRAFLPSLPARCRNADLKLKLPPVGPGAVGTRLEPPPAPRLLGCEAQLCPHAILAPGVLPNGVTAQ